MDRYWQGGGGTKGSGSMALSGVPFIAVELEFHQIVVLSYGNLGLKVRKVRKFTIILVYAKT